MVIEATQRAESTSAEIAFEPMPVPGAIRGDGFDAIVARHRHHGASDNISSIHFLYHGIDFVAVETRGAVAGFEMDSHA